jgi:hypothetical protein
MSHDDDWRDILQDVCFLWCIFVHISILVVSQCRIKHPNRFGTPSANKRPIYYHRERRLAAKHFVLDTFSQHSGATFLTESDSLISVSVCPPTPRSTGPDTLEHSQNPANPDVVLITVVAPPDDLETQGHSESPSSERALHDLPAE